MRSPTRIALVVVGLTAAVYGTASRTGEWLGTPPWWERCVTEPGASPNPITHFADYNLRRVAIPGREGISGGVAAAGLALAAFGAWPRRGRMPA